MKCLVALVALLALFPATAGAAKPAGKRAVLIASNNWDGTASVIDAKSFKELQRFDVVPDKQERLDEIYADPYRLGFFLGIRQLIGEGHDQFVDDGFTSPDGRFVYFSRPSFADVVAISLKTKEIVWRTPVEGVRSDHMAISRNGRTLLVSASTARKVHVIDTRTGEVRTSFESGDQPHENTFSRDGTKVFHASIGTVYTPTDEPAFDSTKGDRWFEVVDARTWKVLDRLDMGAILKMWGYPNMSSAVRPMALSPNERFVYFQVSFFHGFVEFDLEEKRPRRVVTLPISDKAAALDRTDYLLDSAHHGLAMSGNGRALCVAGTMSDYGAVVNRRTMTPTIAARGSKPYWATTSADGKSCVMSFSGDDRVALISYAKRKEVKSVQVGDHPQRVRPGFIRTRFLRKAS